MWNWKLIYEDEDTVCYCDIENITDADENEEGIYRSHLCFKPLSSKVMVWVNFFYKNREILKDYLEYLKTKNLYNKNYKNFNNSLCLVEFNAEIQKYRVIPVMDYDSKGKEIGDSKIITDEGVSFIKGIKGEWSPVRSKNTSRAIINIYNFLFRRK